MRAVAIIPARYRSSRYPGKPLVEIAGTPMVLRVCAIAAEALGGDNVVVATEDQRIVDVVQAGGFNAVMTSDEAPTGTDRLAEAVRKLEGDVFVNVQGDEPMLDPATITTVVEARKQHPGCVINAMCRLGEDEDPHNRNLPKVVASRSGRMLYMSRAAVPAVKSGERSATDYWKQVCVYAFDREQLEQYQSFGKVSEAEQCEDIEILRFLEIGTPVQMVAVEGGTHAVDVPSDVAVVEAALANEA